MTCPKPAGPGWHGRASDQLSLTLERTVGSWSELGAVETHVLLGSAEKRHKQRDGTWAEPLDSLPGTFLSVCRRLPLGSRGVAGKPGFNPPSPQLPQGAAARSLHTSAPNAWMELKTQGLKAIPTQADACRMPTQCLGTGWGSQTVC